MGLFNDRTEVFTIENGWVHFWKVDPTSGDISPGEKIKVENFFSDAKLTTEGVNLWQGLIKQAIASDKVRDLTGANAHSQTPENGVYATDGTTTELPVTNKVGILEVYNENTLKYLRYQTFNTGRIEIWTQFYNGTTWEAWNYSNGASTDTAADGVEKTAGVYRWGGALTQNRELDIAGFIHSIIGSNGQFTIEIVDDPLSQTSRLEVIPAHAKIGHEVSGGESFAVQLDNNGIGQTHFPITTKRNALPGNDTQNAAKNTVYITDAATLNMPATTLVGILECFDHDDSGNVELRYTTFTAGIMEIWGRKKSGVSWYDWATLKSHGIDDVLAIAQGLTANRSINVGLNDFDITRLNGTQEVKLSISNFNGSFILKDTSVGKISSVQFNLNNASISHYSSGSTAIIVLLDGTSGATVQDTIFSRGLGDLADYSANKTDYSYATKKMLNETVDSKVAGLLDYRGAYDASGNVFPSSGGSGTAGAILKGDMWVLSVAGNLGGVDYQVGDFVIANVDSPGQNAANWDSLNTNLSYVPEDVANKENTTLDDSILKYPTNRLAKEYVDNWGIDDVLAVAQQLTVDRDIDVGANQFTITYTSGTQTSVFRVGPNSQINVNEPSTSRNSVVQAQPSGVALAHFNSGNGMLLDLSSVTGSTVQDGIFSKGLTEIADYSANKTDYSYATKKMLNDAVDESLQIYTADMNIHGAVSELNNVSIYHKLFVRRGKAVTKARLLADGVSVNTLTVKLYNSLGNEITNGAATLTPGAASSGYQILELNFAASITLSDATFYWIGIHQAVGGGTSLASFPNARVDTNWNTAVTGAGLAVSVPTGTASNVRICIELL